MKFLTATVVSAGLAFALIAPVQASSTKSPTGPEISKKAYLAKCSKDIKAHCSAVGKGESKVLKCLISKSKVRKSCKAAAKKRQKK